MVLEKALRQSPKNEIPVTGPSSLLIQHSSIPIIHKVDNVDI